MTRPLQVCPATPEDASWAVPLIQGIFLATGRALTGTATDEDAALALLPFFRARGNRLSFERTLVAWRGPEPLGLAVSYPGAEAEALDRPFQARLRHLGLPDRLETEAAPDEYYLDTLVAVPGARGSGVGTALVEAVSDRARALGWTRLGLLVEPHNTGARRLYDRLGFVEAGRRTVTGYDHLHLTRDLGASTGTRIQPAIRP